MSPSTVLISGAGVAGPTLAFWLARHGFRPTVVERAAAQRSSGNPVDVRGEAIRVAEQMGVLPRLRDVATRAPNLAVVTAAGHRIGPSTLGRPRGAELEVLRSDLATILQDAAGAESEFLFNDSITTLRQDSAGVDVTFDHAAPRRFDLVIGADGLHSAVRALAFAPEADCVRHLGIYVATMLFGHPADDPDTVLLHNMPGRLVAVHPARGNAGAAFIFRSPAVAGLDHRDTARCKQVVVDAYQHGTWKIPELLERLRETTDLYFDAVSQVHLPSWSRGRVALVGDAAASVSLFGDGSTMAMIAARTLADALAGNPNDHGRAFRAYETRHRKLARAQRRSFSTGAAILVPATRTGVAVRNLAVRLLPRAGKGQAVDLSS